MSTFKVAETERQARFRTESSSISLVARNPEDPSGRKHGHLLALGHEAENLIPAARGPGGAEDFFFIRDIKWWKADRAGDTPNQTPTRNLASSQVLCVNFLYPLIQHPAALTSMLQAIDDDVETVEPIVYRGLKASPSPVEFEWVGERRPLEENKQTTRGAHVTSVDALLTARLKSGGFRAYLMEWKYTENYSSKREEDKDATRKKRYHARYTSPTSPFKNGVPFSDWLYDPFYQIMRLLLLGRRMAEENELGVTEAVVVVVCPDGNVEYRDRVTSRGLKPFGSKVEDVIKGVLKNPKDFRMTAPADLLRAVQGQHGGKLGGWATYLHERYGW